jgi:nuclear migration protein JNM1
VSREELDSGSLMRPDEASKQFRRAEKKHRKCNFFISVLHCSQPVDRSRLLYAYPPSSVSSSRSPSPDGLSARTQKPVPLSQRLRVLQAELTVLETELADPSNPLLQKEREENVDPGELIKGLVDVRGRIEKIRKDKEGRGKLIGVIVGDENVRVNEKMMDSKQLTTEEKVEKSGAILMTDMDRRVGNLENIIGSSNIALDEVRCIAFARLSPTNHIYKGDSHAVPIAASHGTVE